MKKSTIIYLIAVVILFIWIIVDTMISGEYEVLLDAFVRGFIKSLVISIIIGIPYAIFKLIFKPRDPVEQESVDEFDVSVFDKIKHTDDNGNDYWDSRELYDIFAYTTSQFNSIMKAAQESCSDPETHFIPGKTYKMSAYACYLFATNAKSYNVASVAAQKYFSNIVASSMRS